MPLNRRRRIAGSERIQGRKSGRADLLEKRIGAVALDMITDGASNTIAIGEGTYEAAKTHIPIIPGNGSHQRSGTDPGFWAGVLPNSFDSANWADEIVQKKTDYFINLGGDDDSFASYHKGGAHFLFADGSVHFLSENIQSVPGTGLSYFRHGTLQKLGSRNDGQSIGQF